MSSITGLAGSLLPGGTNYPIGSRINRDAPGALKYFQLVPSGGGQVQAATTPPPDQTPQNDPFSKYGGQGAYNNLVSGFDTQKQNIYGTSKEAAQNAGISRQSSILDFIQSLQSGQRSIDERGVQNELGKKQGYQSIMDMVGRGVRSGGTLLANRNASDSSATEALARAYGETGRRQLGAQGNEYELENRNIGMAQDDFNLQRGTGLRKFDESKTQTVNNIVIDARNRLAALDAAIAEADLPTRIQIEQDRENIKNEVLGILSQYDQQLAQGAGGVQAASTEDRRRTAFGLANDGVASANPFELTTETPAQFQGTGAFPGQLPIFTQPRGRREA